MGGHQAAEWRLIIHSWPCPVCTAGPGEYCVTQTGHRKSEPHADRSRIAAQHLWRYADQDGS
jgi:hypothetical protein